MSKSNVIKGKTKTGFEYEIPLEQMDNYELLEVIAETDENPALLPKMMKMFLGDSQMKKLKEHVRNENGVVEATKMEAEIVDIFSGVQDLKK